MNVAIAEMANYCDPIRVVAVFASAPHFDQLSLLSLHFDNYR
jgi:hypothetical protein